MKIKPSGVILAYCVGIILESIVKSDTISVIIISILLIIIDVYVNKICKTEE